MLELDNFYKTYPDLPLEALYYFSIKNLGGSEKLNIINFITYYIKKYKFEKPPSPKLVSEICDRLTQYSLLEIVNKGGFANSSSSYLSNTNESEFDSTAKKILTIKTNCIAYGPKFIYDTFKEQILPIEYTDYEGKKYLGTSFIFFKRNSHCKTLYRRGKTNFN